MVASLERPIQFSNIKVQSVHFSDHMLVKWSMPIHPQRFCLRKILSIWWLFGPNSRLLISGSALRKESMIMKGRAWSRYWTGQWTSQEMRRQASLSTEALRAKRLRRQLERRWLKTRLESDRQAYRQSCRVANDLITRSLQNSNAQVIDEASRDSRSLWRAVNKLLHPSSSTSLPGETSCGDRCNSIAAYFVHKLDNIRRLIRARLGSAVVKHFADPAHAGPVMPDLSPVTPAAKAITSMKSKTSPLDILKNCVDVFADVISRLANLSFEQGIFPTAFKRHRLHHCWRNPVLIRSCLRVIVQSPISTPFQRYWKSYSWPGSSHSSWHLRTFVECNPHTEKVTAPKLLCCTYTMTFSSQQKGNSIGQPRSQRRIRHGGPRQVNTAVVGLFRIDWCCGHVGPVLPVDQRPFFESNSDGIGNSSRFGIRTVPFLTYVSPLSKIIPDTVRKLSESNSDGIGNSSRFGIRTVPFLTYVSPLSKIIPDTVKFHQYADDTQLYCISTSEFASEVTRLQDCVRDVSDWFLTNCMQLNPKPCYSRLAHRQPRSIQRQPSTSQVRLWNYPPTSGASEFTRTVNSIWTGMWIL